MVTAVVLAAGRGERMGGVAKALLPLERDASRAADSAVPIDDTVLGAIVKTARDAGVERVRVVVGPPYGDAVAAVARLFGCEIVVNPAPERGMGSSVAVGFSGLAGELALLWPVDHPYVTADSVRAVIDAAGDADVVVPRVGDVGGHPVAVAAAVWPALAVCEIARDVLRDPRWRRRDLNLDDPGLVKDIDS
jgi:CTP:molybdopterin cytidylyltransferase MocA